jgi:hypothetical protein
MYALGHELLSGVGEFARSIFQCGVDVGISDDLATILESKIEHLNVQGIKLRAFRHCGDDQLCDEFQSNAAVY